MTIHFDRDMLREASAAYGPILGRASLGGPVLGGVLIGAQVSGRSRRFVSPIGIGFLAALRVLGDTGTVVVALGSGLSAVTVFGLTVGGGNGWNARPLTRVAGGHRLRPVLPALENRHELSVGVGVFTGIRTCRAVCAGFRSAAFWLSTYGVSQDSRRAARTLAR